MKKLIQNQKVQKKEKVQPIEDFVINKSSTQLSNQEIELLNMGLKFALPPCNFPIDSIIADVETTVSMCDTEEIADAIRNEAENHIKTFKFDQSNKCYQNNKFTKASKALKKKINEDNIIITKAD